MRRFGAFIIGLFLIAAFFRVDFFFYILYLLFGIFFFAQIWTNRALRAVHCAREYSDRAFLGDKVAVTLHVRNDGVLPLPWLSVHESLPIQLKSPNFFQCVTSLLPREEKVFQYELDCRRRGYYLLGPLFLNAGDLFGLRVNQKRVPTRDVLLVYPQVVPLTELGLPAQTPFGEIPTTRHIFEDPARMMGVREYQVGDSIRHIHWKTTAATGTLQVKRFEPAISVEAQIFLDLDRRAYTQGRVNLASELAIVAAASIANYLVEKRQKVGVSCNGFDPMEAQEQIIELPPARGRDQLMRVMDILARVQLGEKIPFSEVLGQASYHLSWGGTGIIIAPHADDSLFETMLLMKRSGFHVVLILVDPQEPFARLQRRAHEVGIRAYQLWQEKDLDMWR